MNRNAPSSDTLLSQIETSVDLSVIIPVFNEQENLSPLANELVTVLEELGLAYEILFVDDGSLDGSYETLEQLHKENPQIRVIQFRRNFGQTAAFAAGFEHARGNFIATLDADGQNDPADIAVLLAKMQEGDYDVIAGWRVNRKEPLLRRILSGMANRIISLSTRIVIHDRGCSLKLFRSDLAKSLRLYGQLHRFLPELASSVGAKVAEAPVNDRPRRFGKSKYGALTRTPRVLLDLFTVFYLLSFFSSPMRFFGTVGLFASGVGTLIGSGLAIAKSFAGLIGGWDAFHAYEIGNRPLLLLAFLLILVGVQFLLMGLLGEMIMRTYYEAQGKPTYFIRQILE